MKNFCLLILALIYLSSCEPDDPYKYELESFIEMKKDPCFGFCPVYSFKVDGKGNAVFNGDRNISKIGNWTRLITPEETNKLFEAFEMENFWTFENEYTSQVTDLPTTWTTLKIGEKSKTIKDYYGAPEELKALEKMVEEIAETDDGWIKVTE